MRIPFLLCGWLLTLTAACVQPQRPRGEVAPPVTLRFERGLPLLEVELAERDRSRRAWFLLDTGAGDLTLVDSMVAQQLQVPYRPHDDPGRPWLNLRTRIGTLTTAGFGRDDLEAFVLPLSERPEFAGLDLGGVLGTAFFRGTELAIDLRAGRMWTGLTLEIPGAPLVQVPLEWAADGTLRCLARLNGTPLRAFLDTGTSHSSVSASIAGHAPVTAQADADSIDVATPFGLQSARPAEHAQLQLAQVELGEIPLLVLDTNRESIPLLIGTDVLSRYLVHFDFSMTPVMNLYPPTQGE